MGAENVIVENVIVAGASDFMTLVSCSPRLRFMLPRIKRLLKNDFRNDLQK